MKRERREKSGSQGRSPGQPRGKGGGGDRELEGKEGEPGEKSRAAQREGGREKAGRQGLKDLMFKVGRE